MISATVSLVEIFAANLRAVRRASGISQVDLANAGQGRHEGQISVPVT
jgi:hypothetical protein